MVGGGAGIDALDTGIRQQPFVRSTASCTPGEKRATPSLKAIFQHQAVLPLTK